MWKKKRIIIWNWPLKTRRKRLSKKNKKVEDVVDFINEIYLIIFYIIGLLSQSSYIKCCVSVFGKINS